MTFKTILLILSSILSLYLSILIAVKASNKKTYYPLIIATLSISVWSFAIMMFIISNINNSLLWNQIFIISSGIIPSTFLHFTLLFTKSYISKPFKILLHSPNIFIVCGVITPGILIKNIILRPWGKESILGNFYWLFAIYFICYVGMGLIILLKKSIKVKGHYQQQLLYMLVGTSISSIVGVYFNLILILIGEYRFIWIGPINGVLFPLIITYAILKHELMDIRLAITKTLSYFISISLLFITYIFPLLLIHNKFILSIIIILLSVFWAFFFLPFSKFLITSGKRKFIKGYYDFFINCTRDTELTFILRLN